MGRPSLLLVALAACSVDRSTVEVDPTEVPTATALQCQTGEVIAWDGSGWICQPLPDGGGATVDYTVFGFCAGDDKVRGIDPATGAVQCAADNDRRELPPRHRWGLEVETTGASSVRIRSGECRDRDDSLDITLTAADDVDMSIPGDAEVFVESPSFWYYVWIIADSTRVNAPRGFLSVSASAPVYPAGYDRGRLLAAVRNDGAANFLPFAQAGKTSVWVNQREVMVYEGSGPAANVYISIGVSPLVPPGTEVARVLYANQLLSSTSSGVWFRDPDVPEVEDQLVTQVAVDGAGYAIWNVPVGGAPGAEVVEYKRSLGAYNWMLVQGYAWGGQEM